MASLRTRIGGWRSALGHYAEHGSYDTHSEQRATDFSLLYDLGYALKSFFDELTASKLADRVVVLCFSEFGRRVGENASRGTDHGTSGPVFLAGPAVTPGLIGTYPSLTDLDGGDLKMTVNFRRVYSSVLENWLRVPSAKTLNGSFVPLPLFRA